MSDHSIRVRVTRAGLKTWRYALIGKDGECYGGGKGIGRVAIKTLANERRDGLEQRFANQKRAPGRKPGTQYRGWWQRSNNSQPHH